MQNKDGDSEWFAAINPCGLQSGIVSLSRFVEPLPLPELATMWMRNVHDLLTMHHSTMNI